MFRKLMGVSVFVLLLSLVASPAQAVPIFEGAFLTVTDVPGQGTTRERVPDRSPPRQCLHPVHLVLPAGDQAIVKNGFEVFQVVGITTWAEMEMAATGGDDVTLKDPWTPDGMDLSEVPRGRLGPLG